MNADNNDADDDAPNDNELDNLRRSAAQATSDAQEDPYPLMLRELVAEMSDWADRLGREGVSSPAGRLALREVLLRAIFELMEATSMARR